MSSKRKHGMFNIETKIKILEKLDKREKLAYISFIFNQNIVPIIF